MTGHYILENGEVYPVDLMDWAKWIEDDTDFSKRRIDQTYIGDSEVSTVFLGLDHNWSGGAPILFETLVFGGKLDGEMNRYSSLEDAKAGHLEMVGRVTDSTP